MEICTCHYKENLEWLKSSPWPVNVVHKDGGDPFPQEFLNWSIPNVGAEATSYLSYIIKRYDTLPDHVAFIHGHETSPHQLGDRPLLDMIRDANKTKYHFVPLNNYWHCVVLLGVHSYLLKGFEKYNLQDINPNFIVCGGAQFIVSKERILKNSLDFYKTLYEGVTTREDAVTLELIWHFIFGEKLNIIPREDHFEPPLLKIKYSSATVFPMKTSEFNLKIITEPDEDFDNSGTTYVCHGSEHIKNVDYEVNYVKPHELETFRNGYYNNCLFFENLYLEALGA